ncbi:hypothetical protein [Geotalea daltonii]|uniref:hypothetical protein n=1 Tax=Geotalea daltonii TaxID=1203471 RepID=UPI0012B662C7|nr:hypothetical protein [Geotalea daltonii]
MVIQNHRHIRRGPIERQKFIGLEPDHRGMLMEEDFTRIYRADEGIEVTVQSA